MASPLTIPVPKDPGGGYTHEQHKKNATLIYNAGQIYSMWLLNVSQSYAAIKDTLTQEQRDKIETDLLRNMADLLAMIIMSNRRYWASINQERRASLSKWTCCSRQMVITMKAPIISVSRLCHS